MDGLIIGGWILGLAQSTAVVLWGTGWREMVSAVMLIVLLTLKPHGILGQEEQ
jgi:branched-subunit amino acid ABC-type transport system permease component